MRREFCTLSDSKYRVKLLVLHQTLMEHVGDFRLHVLCLDDALFGLLSQLALKNTRLIRLKDFVDPKLASKRTTRTLIEWYWTMTPSLPLYILNKHPGTEEIAYLDADLCFYSSPEPMYEEIGDAPMMVIPHHFTPKDEKRQAGNGRFNVGLVWWRRCETALAQLRWWREKCLDWCHLWQSQGRFADQGYLNNAPEEYGAHILEHPGCNLAPWSMGLYNYKLAHGGEVYVSTGRKQSGPGAFYEDLWPLIFFHFNEFRVSDESTADFFRGYYARTPFVEKYIYAPYEKRLREQIERIRPYVQSTR